MKTQGKATTTAWQSTISSGQLQLWLIRILQLLISRECFWGEAEREWWEAEVTSAQHCVLWETKHPTARSPQWKSESSNSFSPQQCKWWSWNCAVWQGSRISREFHCSSPSWWCCSIEEFSLQYLERKTSRASFTQDPEWVDWLLKKSLSSG